MELKDFVTNTLLEINEDLEHTDNVCKAIRDYAEKKAKNGLAIIPDDEVKNFILKYDFKQGKAQDIPAKQTFKPKKADNSFEQMSIL